MEKIELEKVCTEAGLWYRKGVREFSKSVIFLHGLGDTPDHFLPVANMVTSFGYCPVLIDLPGHGINRSVKGSFSDCLNSLDVVYQIEGSKDSIIIGHSLGGLIGLVWAARRGELSVPKLLMIEPSITVPDFAFFKLIQAPPLGIGIAPLTEIDSDNDYHYHHSYVANVAKTDRSTLRRLAEDIYQHFNVYRQEVIDARLKFTYVYGRSSSSPEERERMKNWPGVEVLSYEGAEHWVHLDSDFITPDLISHLANS